MRPLLNPHLLRTLTLTASVILLAGIAAGCDSDDESTTPGDAVADTTPNTDTWQPESDVDVSWDTLLPPDIGICNTEPPRCCVESSDVEGTASCTEPDGWSCDMGSPDNCGDPTPSCADTSGYLCCEEDGTSSSARCPTPSQPYCPSGVTPMLTCPAVGDPVEFIEDDVLLDFESTRIDIATTQRAQFCGTLDPLPDAVDDERTLCLTLELDGDAMHTVALNTPIEVSGETVSEMGATENQAGPWSYTVDETADGGLLEAAIVEQSCFCSHYGPYTQTWSGDLTVTDREADHMSLAVRLQMDGNYTFDGFADARVLLVDGKLTLATCPEGPQSPLGESCERTNVTCRYGYDPIECGGITVQCDGTSWIEVEHTDPMTGCFEP